MANWEVNKTKRYNKPIEEHDAKIRGQAFRIEASEGSDKGVLYLWNDLRGYERIASGSVADLKRQAEGMGKREARGVAAIERRANYSRPGAKDTMAVEDRFYFGKGRKAKFAWNDARGKTPEYAALMRWDRTSEALRSLSEKFAAANDKSYGQFMRAEDEAEARKIYAEAQAAARSYAKSLAALVSNI
jgi:hypothetical protein